MKIYDVIVTDPPWSYWGAKEGMGKVGKEYKTMTDEDIIAYRYPLSMRGVLFMWCPCGGDQMSIALEAIKAHDLAFRGIAFVWVKTKKDGVTPVGAMGVRASIVKYTTELVLAASYVKRGRPMPLHDETITQTILAPHVRTNGQRHSQKPEALQDRLERMYPNASKAEFFARRHREGWDCFGDEL